jgi:hypothetical protein
VREGSGVSSEPESKRSKPFEKLPFLVVERNLLSAVAQRAQRGGDFLRRQVGTRRPAVVTAAQGLQAIPQTLLNIVDDASALDEPDRVTRDLDLVVVKDHRQSLTVDAANELPAPAPSRITTTFRAGTPAHARDRRSIGPAPALADKRLTRHRDASIHGHSRATPYSEGRRILCPPLPPSRSSSQWGLSPGYLFAMRKCVRVLALLPTGRDLTPARSPGLRPYSATSDRETERTYGCGHCG